MRKWIRRFRNAFDVTGYALDSWDLFNIFGRPAVFAGIANGFLKFLQQTPLYLLVLIGCAIFFPVAYAFRKRLLRRKARLEVVEIYEENINSGGECGVIFRNIIADNLCDCHARLLKLVYETPHDRFTLDRIIPNRDLICDKKVAGFSNGKIPLVRWGRAYASKDMEFVYNGGTEKVAYDIANTPILLLLNIWAENVPATYCIFKLSDRMGCGYGLSIVKTGLQQDNPNLAEFQILNSDKEGSVSQ